MRQSRKKLKICIFKSRAYSDEHYDNTYKYFSYNDLNYYIHTIMIIHQLSIYTSMKHSLLLLETFSTCAQLFRHPV
jgi:hypothetical protein